MGYEASLKKLEQAISKVNPGASISKELIKAIDIANTQLKALGKNLTPQATNDTQIDAIVGKVNNLGEAIQRVASLMGEVDLKDLDLDAFGKEFGELRNQIVALENELENNLDKGIKHTVTHSKKLKEAFGSLGIDASKMSKTEIFEALNASAQKAENSIKSLEEELNKLKNSNAQRQVRIEQIENSALGTYQRRDELIAQAEALNKEYVEALSDPKEVSNKLRELVESVSLDIKNSGQIYELLDKGEFEKAVEQTVKEFQDAQTRLQREKENLNKKIHETQQEIVTTESKRDEAQQQKTVVSEIQKALEKRVEKLTKDNEDLLKRIEKLEEELQSKKEAAVADVRDEGTRATIGAETFKITAEEAGKYKNALEQVHEREQLIGRIQGVVQRWFSIYAAVRMVNKAIRSVISTIQELDKTITEIAIVTNMTQSDLWNQMSSYTDMARQYASSISGVYKVSQLYYQQGLQTAEVMALTEQTLKMARISGLDYAEATNYMTNAVRSFKMEMTDAQRVVDVYSAVAASSATNVTELAKAMSKTASSAEAVGSSFENTTAMMAVMIEATRESAENIGSALKSIISR